MVKSSKDTGTILMLLDRFSKQRLPKANDMKARLLRGEILNDRDEHLIKLVKAEIGQIAPLVGRHPEYRELYDNADAMWKEIIAMNAENKAKAKK